jgi:hypothetical protein
LLAAAMSCVAATSLHASQPRPKPHATANEHPSHDARGWVMPLQMPHHRRSSPPLRPSSHTWSDPPSNGVLTNPRQTGDDVTRSRPTWPRSGPHAHGGMPAAALHSHRRAAGTSRGCRAGHASSRSLQAHLACCKPSLALPCTARPGARRRPPCTTPPPLLSRGPFAPPHEAPHRR